MSSSPQDTSIVSLSSPDLKFEVTDDLRLLTSTPEFDKLVKDKYGAINVKETMESLVDCGQMLQVALTAAEDQPCSLPILEILSKYQDLVHSCTVTSNKFVFACLLALQQIKDASDVLHEIPNDELEECIPDILEILANTFDTAKSMSQEADQVAKNVGKVKDLAEKAVLSAKNDLNTNTKSNLKIEKQLQEAKAEAAATEHLVENYARQLKQLAIDKNKAAQDAAQARDRQFSLNMVGAVMSGLGTMSGIFADTAKAVSPYAAAGNTFANTVNAIVENSDNTSSSNLPSADATAANTSTASMGKSNDTYSSTNSQIDLPVLESKVQEQKQLLEDAESAPGKDSVDGKKLIEDRKQKLQAATDSLKTMRESFTKVANNQKEISQSLEAKESEVTQRYYAMAEAEAKKAAEQKKQLEEMKHMKTNKSQLEQTIFLLQFSYGIMGDVKTTFTNAKTFWELLASECNMIAEMKQSTMNSGNKVLEKASKPNSAILKTFRKMFEKGIIRSAESWAGVGRISLDAYESIVEAKDVTDKVMSALPTGKATDEIINRLIKQIEPRITDKIKNYKGKKQPAMLKDN